MNAQHKDQLSSTHPAGGRSSQGVVDKLDGLDSDLREFLGIQGQIGLNETVEQFSCRTAAVLAAEQRAMEDGPLYGLF